MDLQKKTEEAFHRIEILEKTLAEKMEKDSELVKLIESLDDQIFCIQKDKDGDYIITYNEGKLIKCN